MTISTHISQLNNLIRTDKMDRAVLLTVHQQVLDRIFEKGQDANKSQIGTYSESYIKQRVKNNWPRSRKVILQATRQMVQDFSLITIARGKYGSGFKNSINGKKRRWLEKKYSKKIFELTNDELALIPKLYEEALRRYFN